MGAWGICDRCGWKVRHASLRKEWTNLLVCRDCWDPRPADMSPPKIGPEGMPLRDARPEPEPIILSPGDVTEEDL